MTDTPPPEASPAHPTPPASSKRPWTILGRLSKAVREQNWFAVVLELGIVVIGVFLGIQLGNWNAARADARLGRDYTERLLVDLRQDREARQGLAVYYDAIEASGERTVELLAREGDDLELVIHAYRATEINASPQLRATWDEIISAGKAGLLPRAAIEGGVGDYYSYDLHSFILDGRDAPYRRAVRGTIPHVLQRSIRENCSDVLNDIQNAVGFRSDCTLNVDEELVAETASALRSDSSILRELRNRFSELGVIQSNILGDVVLLDRAIAALEGHELEAEETNASASTTPVDERRDD